MTVVTTGAMSVPMSGDNFPHQYSVIADTRRRWSEAEKEAFIGEALQPGGNVSAVTPAAWDQAKPSVSLAEDGAEGNVMFGTKCRP